MHEISAEVVLRPTRIGFLTRPNDLSSIRKIMRACVCIWGGQFNPIIPVFKRPPKEWTPEIHERQKAGEVAQGYVRFFEPDVYVEAEKGLLEEAGLKELRLRHSIQPEVIPLEEYLKPERNYPTAEPAFGLNIFEVLADIYQQEQRFVTRDKIPSLIVSADRNSALTEAVFGAYPTQAPTDYIRRAFSDVYRPEKISAGPDAWRRVFLQGAVTPLRVTRHNLNPERYWHHDPLIFVFDPSHTTDLIDLWNLRLEPRPVLPLPLQWFEPLRDDIYKILKAEHRPVAGNPNGIMHKATMEFGRAISKAIAEELSRSLDPGLPQGALTVKFWRNPIWIEGRDRYGHRDQRLRVVASERRFDLVPKDDGSLTATFEPLEPLFATQYSKGAHRWANVVSVSSFNKSEIATVIPFNTFDRSWPRLSGSGERIPVGMEGWVFTRRYKGLSQYISFINHHDVIVGSLERIGIKAELSEPGHIARQMIENLGGLWGAHCVADVETIGLLNKMAGGLKRRSNNSDTIEENFGLRTAPLKDWNDLLAARRKRESFSRVKLSDFTNRNIIKLGLETDCPHCLARNWCTLTDADYKMTCERCLKNYDFPQADVKTHNRNFSYRVVGPFSVPDYGKGSYSALLTLRFLDRFNSSHDPMTFSTAMTLTAERLNCEVDFIAWRGKHGLADRQRPPTLVIGEAKSLGKGELIEAKDIAKIKLAAARLPDAVVVISVLRDHFTANERKLLTKFVNWGRRVNAHGEPTNPVVLLTANELMMEHFLSATWKKLGGRYAEFVEFNSTNDLISLADSTQQIYLDLSPFHQARAEYWERRRARSRSSKLVR